MRRLLLGLLLLPMACAEAPPLDAARPAARPRMLARAADIGALVRAAMVCGRSLPVSAQDRAARLETAALALRQEEAGTEGRDAFLRSMEPPAFTSRQGSRDRRAWCSAREAEIARLEAMLAGPEGEALTAEAERLAPPE
ncbi:hypothetical protein JYK14_09625 [Siccirubricoccus sp. KC 17139]|uniref:Secreted protein n=1 Tax=Siccirubricoccus soli TaxID=2899147 RepID=A0ABT1D556_9PROT|nr:hypothetical protein [Siccirubricoccus soli]MCO6416425.1 hypothetical protein [Siccirubricoccus soli]MCP2682559.1 hypothetical protein [Siccirubricoccus soli]